MNNAGGIKAGQAYVEVGAKDKTGLSLGKVKEKLKKFGEAAIKTGLGVMAAGGAILGALAKIVQFTVETGTELDAASRKTGETVESLSTLKQAAAETGMSFDELVRTLEQGGDGLEEIRARASQLTPVMSGEAARSAKEFGDTIGQVQAAIHGAVVEMGGALLPTLKEIATPVMANVRAFGRWIAANKVVMIAVLALGAGLVVGGAALVGLGVAVSGAAAAITVLQATIAGLTAVVGFLASPVGLTVVAIAALVAGIGYLVAQSETGKEIIADLSRYFSELWARAKETWQGITDAIRAGDWGLAAQVAWVALKLEFFKIAREIHLMWAQMMNSLSSLWKDFVNRTIGNGTFRKVLEILSPAFAGANWLADQANFDIGGIEQRYDARIARLDRERKDLIAQAAAARRASEAVRPAVVAQKYADIGIAQAAKGTFSSFGISQSLAINDRIAERAAKAAEKTAINTQKIAEKIGVLSFV